MKQKKSGSSLGLAAAACPCGSAVSYEACCGRYHRGPLALQAPTPEALMRSRYGAFVLDVRTYLIDTWHPDTRPELIEPPEPGLQWLGLEVRVAAMEGADRGLVEFVARSKLAGRAHRLHELSEFVQEQGRWFYLKARET